MRLSLPPTPEATAPGTRRRWPAVVTLALTNLLPLAFVLHGSLDLPLLVTCYLLEGILFFALTPARAQMPWQARWAFPVALLVFGAAAPLAVDWGVEALLVLAATVLLFVAGLGQARRLDSRSTGRGPGAFGWHLLVVAVGAMVAVPYMQHVSVLRDAGWTPHPMSEALIAPWSYAVNRLLVDSQLSPAVLGTAIFVTFKTVNEVVFSISRILRGTDDGSGGGR